MFTTIFYETDLSKSYHLRIETFISVSLERGKSESIERRIQQQNPGLDCAKGGQDFRCNLWHRPVMALVFCQLTQVRHQRPRRPEVRLPIWASWQYWGQIFQTFGCTSLGFFLQIFKCLFKMRLSLYSLLQNTHTCCFSGFTSCVFIWLASFLFPWLPRNTSPQSWQSLWPFRCLSKDCFADDLKLHLGHWKTFSTFWSSGSNKMVPWFVSLSS